VGVNEHSWSNERAATLKDVAKAAGVSEPTASVVLNEAKSGTRVSAKTRLVVTEAAQRLGYRPNALARSLQTGQTNRIGVFTGAGRLDSGNLFYSAILGGLFDGCTAHQLNALVHTSGSTDEYLLDLVSNRAVDGLVVHAGQNSPILNLLHELRVPAVAVADRISRLPCVCVDDAAGGTLQAHHLSILGHKEVIYIQAYAPLQSAVLRAEAFTSHAQSLGMRVTEFKAPALGVHPYLSSSQLDLIVRRDKPATAIVAWCDLLAEGICQELFDLGIDVPKRVAVVGFDGFESSYRRRFELTTIRAPWNEVGRIAVSMLVNLRKGASVPDTTILPITFVRGKTS